MSEWLFEAAGEGGTASPEQFWDLADGTVRVGAERVVVTPDDRDFELLRPSRDKNGRYFPGKFAFSPDDGQLLEPPDRQLRLSVTGIPAVADSAKDFFAHEAVFVVVPSGDAAYAGDPAIALICDLATGSANRWSASQSQWLETPPLPLLGGSETLRKPAWTANGFVYAGEECAAAIVNPGSAKWQQSVASPAGLQMLTPAISHGTGAAALARKDGSLYQLVWTTEWRMLPLSGDAPHADAKFSPMVSANGGLAGVVDEIMFEITPDHHLVRRDWPPGFAPNTGCAPHPVAGGLYVMGANREYEPAWAFMPAGGGAPKMLGSQVPATPFRSGFLTEEGWAATPGANVRTGFRLPPNIVGKPLLSFDDAALFLGIDAGSLWPQALCGERRRWRTRLLLASSDGTVRELGQEWKLDRLSRVEAVAFGDTIAILGLQRGQALAWRKDGF
jgi:hypothetical protein